MILCIYRNRSIPYITHIKTQAINGLLGSCEMSEPLDLTALDSEIASIERLLRLSRECQFADIVAQIEGEIAEEILPGMLVLAGIVADEERAAVASRCRHLKGLIARLH